jgi:hypothetical protein
MLAISWIEIFFRSIPEMFIMILGVHFITKQKINKRKYILFSLAMSIITYLVRLLPIEFGFHTIILVIILVVAMTISGIPVIKSIYGVLSILFLLSICEYLSLLIFGFLGIEVNFIKDDPMLKSLLGIPSLIILSLFVFMIYYWNKREGKKNDKFGELSC